MMIETCVDVAGHIISDRAFRLPRAIRMRLKYFRKTRYCLFALFAKMDKMAKFRNIVVHHYGNIDAEIVVEILKRDLGDFLSFRDAVVSFLEKNN